jgi:hypothetical protein
VAVFQLDAMLNNFDWLLAVGAALASLIAGVVVTLVRIRETKLSQQTTVRERSQSMVLSSLVEVTGGTKFRRDATMTIEAVLAGLGESTALGTIDAKLVIERQRQLYRLAEHHLLEAKIISRPVTVRTSGQLAAEPA